jgi:adhesin transport system outer membrane protein
MREQNKLFSTLASSTFVSGMNAAGIMLGMCLCAPHAHADDVKIVQPIPVELPTEAAPPADTTRYQEQAIDTSRPVKMVTPVPVEAPPPVAEAPKETPKVAEAPVATAPATEAAKPADNALFIPAKKEAEKKPEPQKEAAKPLSPAVPVASPELPAMKAADVLPPPEKIKGAKGKKGAKNKKNAKAQEVAKTGTDAAATDAVVPLPPKPDELKEKLEAAKKEEQQKAEAEAAAKKAAEQKALEAAAITPGAPFIRSLVGGGGQDLLLNINDVNMKPDSGDMVSLNDAVSYALKNNFQALAESEKVRGAYWEKLGGYSQYLPSVEFNYQTGQENSKPAAYNDAFGNRALNDNHYRKDRMLTVRQPLIDLAIIADVVRGQNNEDIARSDELDVRETLALDTINVYFKLIQARVAVLLADQYKKYLDDLSERMKARVDGGGGVAADLDRIKGRATLADSARVEALGDYESNLQEFKRLTHVVPARLQIPDQFVPDVPTDALTAMEQAIKTNPAYQSSLEKIDLAADDRNKAFATLAPKLSLEYSAVRSEDAGGSAKGNPVDGVYPAQDDHRIMLVAKWSINGGTAIATGLAGAAKRSEMTARSDDIRMRLEQAIRTGYTGINAAKQRTKILAEATAANQRVVNSFNEQYTDGSRSLFDLLDAYEQLYKARLDLMHISVAEAQAGYQIRRQMGDLVQALVKTEPRPEPETKAEVPLVKPIEVN